MTISRTARQKSSLDAEPFAWRASRDGKVFITYEGRTITTLKGKRAEDFLRKVEESDNATIQVLMARITGNFKRGNE